MEGNEWMDECVSIEERSVCTYCYSAVGGNTSRFLCMSLPQSVKIKLGMQQWCPCKITSEGICFGGTFVHIEVSTFIKMANSLKEPSGPACHFQHGD